MKKDIFKKRVKIIPIRERKDRRALSFRMSIEFLNLMFSYLKQKQYRLLPKDAQIHAIQRDSDYWDSYTIVIRSKAFPITEEGCQCDSGCVRIDKIKGIIELKEIIKND